MRIFNHTPGVRQWLLALLVSGGAGHSTQAQVAAPGVAWQWAATGGGSQGSDYFDRVATDAGGHVFVAGRMRKTATYGDTTLTATGSQDDLLVAKLSLAGGYEWVRRAGSSANDEVTALRVGTNGNVYIEGFGALAMTFGSVTLPAYGPTVGPGYVACLNGTTGAWLWAVRTPANSFSSAMVLDAANNVYVAGAFTDTASFGSTQLVCTTPTAYNPFVAKLSGTGTHAWQWATKATSIGDERVTALATDHAGNLYVGGHFVAPTIQFGTTTLTKVGAQDVFVAKLTTGGAWRWARQVGGVASEVLNDLAATATGGVALSGYFQGTNTLVGATTLTNAGRANTFDGFVARINPAGAIQWATRMGGTKNDATRTVALAPTGEVYVTGFYDSPTVVIGDSVYTNTSAPNNLADSFVARVTASGSAARWQMLGHTTGLNCEFIIGTALDATGNLYLSGCFASTPTATVGPFTVTSSGLFDAFVTKLTPATAPTGLAGTAATAGLTLWPNPARAAVRVAGARGAPVELLDALGRVVQTEYDGAGTDPTLNLQGVLPGVYMVRAGAAWRRLAVE
ncbi:MAG: T9SS type A sorting domain-containing protein [Hymenobacteraceae bacterium]|nr:T9SS type A sorting domain-containing protein [Hymenobacteraceae bacterium]